MSTLLQEADKIAGEDRSRDYGHPYDNHRRIAQIWSVQLEAILKRPIEPREVALMMIGLKLAREINTPKRDNLLDIAGYAKCADMIEEELHSWDLPDYFNKVEVVEVELEVAATLKQGNPQLNSLNKFFEVSGTEVNKPVCAYGAEENF